jgi:hypothetical protein
MKTSIKMSLAFVAGLTTSSAMCAMKVSEQLKKEVLAMHQRMVDNCMGAIEKVSEGFDALSTNPDEITAIYDAGKGAAHSFIEEALAFFKQLP